MIALADIIIDEEFKRLLPPLDEQTYQSLEQSILDYGCMNPLVLWNNILIDGYNRYGILTKHALPFNTTSLDFASRDEVLIWIISTQISRRNLSTMQLTFFRGLHYNTDKKLHGDIERLAENAVNSPSGQNVHLRGSTADRLAEQYKVTSRTIRRDGEIAEVISAIGRVSPDAKRDILSGEARISRKQLREMDYGSKDELETIASEIVAGTYEAEKSTSGDNGSKNGVSNGNKIGFAMPESDCSITLGKYRHYEGNIYKVIGFARNSETLEEMVIYTALYGEHRTWVRPISTWDELVEHDGTMVKRFDRV